MTPKQQALQWLENNALILDTETTGLDERAEIIEISIIDCTGQVLLDTLVKPTSPIPAEATRIHGITNEMVAEAPTWPEVIRKFEEIVIGRDLVIYNADYDLRIIDQTSNLHNILETLWLEADCAMLAYAEFYGQWDDYREQCKWQRLGNAAKQQGVVIEGTAHRALADCKMTLGVIASMAGKWCDTMQRLKSQCGCPDCGSSLVQVSLRKNDLTEMALDGEFEDGERKFIVTAFGHTRVVRVFDNGEALMAQEVWNSEPLGNDCYVDSYPDDSSWFETDKNNSSELLNN